MSPHQHEIDSTGNNCVSLCPACTWAQEQVFDKLKAQHDADCTCEQDNKLCLNCRAEIYAQNRWLEIHVADVSESEQYGR
jgi:hypothetical protein